MTAVTNTLTLPGGDPANGGVRVEVELITGGWHGNPSETEILGVRQATVDGNGKWTLDLTPNADISPANTYYRVKETVRRASATWAAQVPGPVAFTDGSRTTNVVTLTGLAVGHGVEVGDTVVVAAADAGYNGTFVVTGVPTATSITYAQVAANDPSAGVGTLTKTWDLFDILIDLPDLPAPSPHAADAALHNPFAGQVRVVDDDATYTSLFTGANFEDGLSVGEGSVLTLSGGSAYRGLVFNPTLVYDNPSVFTGGRSIEESAILKNPTGVAKTLPHQTGYYSAPTIRGDGALFTTARSAFLDSTAYDTIGGGTVTADHQASFDSGIAIGAGVTVDMRRGLRVADAAGAGTLTTQVGVDILALAKAATNIGIRNASTEVHTPTVQALVAATQITPTARLKRITATAPITLSANPIIADGQDGQRLTLLNSSAFAITFTRTTQGLRLGAATRILNQFDTLELVYSTTTGEWSEISYADNA